MQVVLNFGSTADGDYAGIDLAAILQLLITLAPLLPELLKVLDICKEDPQRAKFIAKTAIAATLKAVEAGGQDVGTIPEA